MAVSLRIILSALICAITVVVALIAFLPTYFAGVSAVDSSIDDLRESYVVRSEQSVETFLDLPLVRLRQAATFFESGLQNSTYGDADSFDRYVVNLIWRERDIFSSVLLFLREGVAPAPGSRSIYVDVSLAPDYPILSTDVDHNVTHRVSYVRAVDPATLQELPSFINTNLTGRWATRDVDYFGTGEIYASAEFTASPSPRVGFQGVRPFADQPLLAAVGELTNPLNNDEVIGLVSINSKLERMQRLTQNLGLRQRSRACAFMIHPELVVLGVSWNEDTFEVVGNPFDFSQRFNSVRIKWFNNLTEGGYLISEVVPTLGLNFLTDRSYSNFSSTINTEEHGKTYIDIVTVKKVNLDLRVLLVMPESDFMDGISKARSAALAATFTAIFLTFGVAIVLANLITNPLVRLQDRMALAARFEDSAADDDGSESCMKEVASMQRSYRNMRNELQRAKAYLPQSILNISQFEDDDGENETKGLLAHTAGDDDEGDIEVQSHGADGVSQGYNATPGDTLKPRAGNSTDDCSKSSRYYDGRSLRSLRSSRRGGPTATTATALNAGLNFSTALNNKRVSILIFNMRKFTMCATPTDISAMQEKQLECVSKHVTDMKGNVDFFQGDFIQCSFNASKSCAQHLRHSLNAALAVVNELASTLPASSNIKNSSASKEPDFLCKQEEGKGVAGGICPPCTVGMSSSVATVGNMGTAAMRRFCVMGQAVQQAILLERMNKVYGTKILAPDSVLNEVQSEFVLRCVDIIRLPRATAGKSSRRSGAPALIVELLENSANKGGVTDEWMYELEQGAAKNPFSKLNNAFRSLMEGEWKQAAEELTKSRTTSRTSHPTPAVGKEEEIKADSAAEEKSHSSVHHHQFHDSIITSERKCQEILDRMEANPTTETLYPPPGWLEQAFLGQDENR